MNIHKGKGLYTPTKRSDAQPLVEREKQLECLPVEISRSLKGKQMLHVLYIIIILIKTVMGN